VCCIFRGYVYTEQNFTNEEIPDDDKQHVLKVFGIDFYEKTVRVARTLNLIAKDGETADAWQLCCHKADSITPHGIAEAFIEWAKSEKLSFWR